MEFAFEYVCVCMCVCVCVCLCVCERESIVDNVVVERSHKHTKIVFDLF